VALGVGWGPQPALLVYCLVLLARDSIHVYAIARYYAIARLSVRLSVTRVDLSKTVEVRITQLSPQSSP